MKKFRHNYTLSFTYFITCIVIYAMPVIMIYWMIFNHKKILDSLLVIPTCILVLLIIYLVIGLINLIITCFTKPKITLENDKINYEGKSYKIEFCDRVVLEKGFFNKYNKDRFMALILFNKDMVLFNIKNPPIRLIYRVIRNKNVKNKEIFSKVGLIILLVLYLIAFLMFFIMLIVSK